MLKKKKKCSRFLLLSHPQKKIPSCLLQLLYFLALCQHKRQQEQIELEQGLKLIHQTDKHVTEKNKQTYYAEGTSNSTGLIMKSERHSFTTQSSPLLTSLYLLHPFRLRGAMKNTEKYSQFTR